MKNLRTMTNEELKVAWVENCKAMARIVCSVNKHVTKGEADHRETIRAELDKRGIEEPSYTL